MFSGSDAGAEVYGVQSERRSMIRIRTALPSGSGPVNFSTSVRAREHGLVAGTLSAGDGEYGFLDLGYGIISACSNRCAACSGISSAGHDSVDDRRAVDAKLR